MSLAEAAHAELGRAITALLLEEPFYGHLLGSVARAVDERVQTAGVCTSGGTIVLAVHPTFFLETLHSDSERVAVIKHEALHLVFRHLFRRTADHHPLLFNLAADLVVNQYIGSRWKLPSSAITLDRFPGLYLPPDRTVEEYYERLHEAWKKERARFARFEGTGHSDHSGWWGSALAEALLERALVSSWHRAGPMGQGTLPGPLQTLFRAWIEPRPPQLDWRRVLRRFCASGGRTRLSSTLSRPSKRYGTFPGIRVRRGLRLLVAIDTSGSILDDDLSDFFGEIFGMWRQGAEILLLECDAAVQRTWSFEGKLPTGVGGRGGTGFDPVFRWASEDRRRWNGLVYLTDGFASPPTQAPPCPLLWVVTRHGSTDSLCFGEVVRLTT